MTFTKFDATDPRYTKKYLGNLHEMLKKMNDRQSLVHLRANILKHEQAKNVQLESDRINGILSQSSLSQFTPNYQRLKNRADDLKKLGANAFNRSIDS